MHFLYNKTLIIIKSKFNPHYTSTALAKQQRPLQAIIIILTSSLFIYFISLYFIKINKDLIEPPLYRIKVILRAKESYY